MATEAIADDARRRSDEAVRRIREASQRRVDRERRRRAFSSWCALASLAGALSLASLDAREARLQEQAVRAADEREARIDAAADKSCQDLSARTHWRALQGEDCGGPCFDDPPYLNVDDQLAMFAPAKGHGAAVNKRVHHSRTGGRHRSVGDDPGLSE